MTPCCSPSWNLRAQPWVCLAGSVPLWLPLKSCLFVCLLLQVWARNRLGSWHARTHARTHAFPVLPLVEVVVSLIWQSVRTTDYHTVHTAWVKLSHFCSWLTWFDWSQRSMFDWSQMWSPVKTTQNLLTGLLIILSGSQDPGISGS